MDNPVEEIKKKIDTVDFIGSYVTLKKIGRNFKANCPFHNEKTPSFIVSPERQIWHCFGSCGEGGDIVKFLMKWENITFVEALRELAKKAGVTLKNVTFDDQASKKKERYYEMNLLAAEFFQYILNKTKFGEKAVSYLTGRGMKPALWQKFKLGYSPVSWDSLLNFLKKKKYSPEEILENGLAVKSVGGRIYDRFRGRLMFPLTDARDHILGFSGRILEGKDTEAKYVNTPETPIYHKRETLFGINLAKDAIKKEKNAYLVEGEFDMITPYAHGLSNFVAIKGSALTQDQLMLLKRFTPKLTLIFDSDEAGGEAVRRGIEEAEKLEIELAVVRPDFAKDPDEAVLKDADAFKKVLKNPQPIYDFLIDAAIKKYSVSDPFGKKKIGDEVMPFIERIGNPIVKSHYTKKIAAILGVTETSIEALMAKIRRRKRQEEEKKIAYKREALPSREVILEKYLLSFVLQNADPYKPAKKIFSVVKPSDLIIPANAQIAQLLLDHEKKFSGSFDLDKLAAAIPSALRPAFDELYLFASAPTGLEDDSLEKLAYELKKLSLKRQIKEILNSEDQSGDRNPRLLEISAALKDVEKKLVSL
ncbi:MAG: DNA primase [Patescibacteria group bacterium]